MMILLKLKTINRKILIRGPGIGGLQHFYLDNILSILIDGPVGFDICCPVRVLVGTERGLHCNFLVSGTHHISIYVFYLRSYSDKLSLRL